MSAKQRPKQQNLITRLLCCFSPHTDEGLANHPPTAQHPSTAVPETVQSTTQQEASSNPVDASREAAHVESEKLPINDDTNLRSAEDDNIDDVTTAPMQNTPSEMKDLIAEETSSEAIDVAPALPRDAGSTLLEVPGSMRQPSTDTLPEEKAALLDDEPLTPASAAMTATTPVVDVVDLPNQLAETVAETHEMSWLLPPLDPSLQGKKCLVLDLDETLVHSSFKVIHQADFVVPVEIDGIFHNVYVIKRPGVDEFMRIMGEHFEIVVFTASLAKYADPVLDMLDIHNVVHHRLFRESCHNHMGNYVKDLSQLGRNLQDAIIIDNSPASYVFHPAHAVPISSWFNDVHDTELTDLIPFLLDLTTVDDVSQVLELSMKY